MSLPTIATLNLPPSCCTIRAASSASAAATTSYRCVSNAVRINCPPILHFPPPEQPPRCLESQVFQRRSSVLRVLRLSPPVNTPKTSFPLPAYFPPPHVRHAHPQYSAIVVNPSPVPAGVPSVS